MTTQSINYAMQVPKKEVLLMFANFAPITPYTFDLTTYQWTTYFPDVKKTEYHGSFKSGKGPLVYDDVSQMLYFTDLSLLPGFLYSMPMRVLDDLNRPKITKVFKAGVVGVSLDTKLRQLFFLRSTTVFSMSLAIRRVKRIADVRNGNKFTTFFRSAVDVLRRKVFFHFRLDKKLYWDGSEGGNVKWKHLRTPVVSLTVDLKGDRLIYTNALDYRSVWTISLDNLESKILFMEHHNIVYPLDDSLLVIGFSRKYVTLRSRDGKTIMRNIAHLENCVHHTCIETSILRLGIPK